MDLFRAVRQGLRAGVESYSIKKIEPLYALTRGQDLKDAGGSIVAFETWLELGADAPVEDAAKILDGIAAYNRDDVLSNWRLRDWLEERRLELEAREGRTLPRPVADDADGVARSSRTERRVAELMERLTEGVPADPADRATDPDAAGRWLLAQLLGWHRREDKSAWWRYFDLLRMTDEELIEEREPLGGLEPRRRAVGRGAVAGPPLRVPAPGAPRSTSGSEVVDPVTRAGAGAVVGLDKTNRHDRPQARPEAAGTPLPTALVPNGIIPTRSWRRACCGSGERVAANGMAVAPGPDRGDPDLGALRALLLRTPPGASRVAAVVRPGEHAARCRRRLAPDLAGRMPPDPGPTGLGQDYTGAHMIVRLVVAGQRVGVVANSHKVIGNLLDKVDAVARELPKRARSAPGPHRPEAEDATARRRSAVRALLDNAAVAQRRSGPAPSTWPGPWPGRGAGRRWRSRSPSWTSCSWTRPAR